MVCCIAGLPWFDDASMAVEIAAEHFRQHTAARGLGHPPRASFSIFPKITLQLNAYLLTRLPSQVAPGSSLRYLCKPPTCANVQMFHTHAIPVPLFILGSRWRLKVPRQWQRELRRDISPRPSAQLSYSRMLRPVIHLEFVNHGFLAVDNCSTLPESSC